MPAHDTQRALVSQIADDVLAYLEHHPDAADTLEGVGREWLAHHNSASRDDVLQALEKLVGEGRLAKRVSLDGRCLFCKRHTA